MTGTGLSLRHFQRKQFLLFLTKTQNIRKPIIISDKSIFLLALESRNS